ncbi:MAG: hypothetical protein JST67_10390 [Bacteroidetes bacterium]|nr:hypothetical protein [Bacteroidota bacterium]
MKKHIFIPLFALWASLGMSQTIPKSFTIANNNHPEKEAYYIQQIEKANMENYRLKSKDVVLKFENGFTCTMLSAKTLFTNGFQVNPANYPEEFPKDFSLPSMRILDDGTLYALYKPKGKFH